MSTTTTLIIVGAAGGLGYLYLRKRAEAAQQSKCGALGDLAGKIAGIAGSDPASVSSVVDTACSNAGAVVSAGQALGGALSQVGQFLGILPKQGPSLAERLAKNTELNGAPEFPESGFPDPTPDLNRRKKGYGVFGSPATGRKYAVVRHANGCIPYSKAPGWSKCAPGTLTMALGSDANQANWSRVGQASMPDRSGDPYSFKAQDGLWWVNGKRVACGAGQTVAIDHRSGAPIGVCSNLTEPPAPPRDDGGAWWNLGVDINEPKTYTVTSDGTRDHREGAT